MPDSNTASRAEPAHRHVIYIFPFLAVAVIAYATLLLVVGESQIADMLDRPMFELSSVTQGELHFFVRDVFVLGIFALLFCETWKSAIHEDRALWNHALSFVVAGACVYSLRYIGGFATTTFLYITLATVFDVAAGIYITWRAKPIKEIQPVFEIKRRK